MNSLDALRLMVRCYPGGIEAVALRVGKPAKTLEKELRNEQGHKLGVLVADEINALCNEVASKHCRAYVNAIAGDTGGFVELPVRSMGRQDLRTHAADMLRECSESISALTEALRDEAISDNERRSIERELGELIEKVQEVQCGVRAVHEASRPARIREAA